MFFLLFLALANASIFTLNTSSPCNNFTQDLILCEGFNQKILTSNTTFTIYFVSKHITTKNFTNILEYSIVVGNLTNTFDVLKSVAKIALFMRYTYDYNICDFDDTVIVYTDIISLNVSSHNGTILNNIETHSEIHMYNDTNTIHNLTMDCNNNKILLPESINWPEKIDKHCSFNGNTIYTELVNTKKSSKC
jgi:glutaredoxin-related protein